MILLPGLQNPSVLIHNEHIKSHNYIFTALQPIDQPGSGYSGCERQEDRYDECIRMTYNSHYNEKYLKIFLCHPLIVIKVTQLQLENTGIRTKCDNVNYNHLIKCLIVINH